MATPLGTIWFDTQNRELVLNYTEEVKDWQSGYTETKPVEFRIGIEDVNRLYDLLASTSKDKWKKWLSEHRSAALRQVEEEIARAKSNLAGLEAKRKALSGDKAV